MTLIAYRIYCDECTNEIVIEQSDIEDHEWKVNSKIHHSGLCPACNDMISVDDDSEYSAQHEEIPFEKLDNIGQTGADNLREEGIVTRQDVNNASDDDILSVSWVGEGGLESIREAVE